MNSWNSPVQEQQSPLASQPQVRPDWFEVLLPGSVVPLLLVLLLILPIFLLAAESLFAPVYEFIQAILIPVNAGMSYTGLPLVLIIKIALFSAFTFTGVTMLLLKISCLYHEVWSYFLHQPHPKHSAYHPDQQDSMIALFNWNLYRWFKVLGPPLGWVGLTILTGAVGLWLFTSFTDFGFFSFQLQFTLGFFAMMVLSVFTALSMVKAVWHALTTILGDVAAITEPEKPAQVLYERSRRLSFGSPWSYILYPLYFLFYVALIAQIILLMATFDITDILHFNPDVMVVFAFESVTLILFVILSGMKFITYHDALARYYETNVR